MVDFAKMSTPEAREQAKQDREIREKLLDQRDKANRFALDALYAMVVDGEIDNEYDVSFIKSIHTRLKQFTPLTEKQEAYLDELFHNRY
jgi:peptide deformylase